MDEADGVSHDHIAGGILRDGKRLEDGNAGSHQRAEGSGEAGNGAFALHIADDRHGQQSGVNLAASVGRLAHGRENSVQDGDHSGQNDGIGHKEGGGHEPVADAEHKLGNTGKFLILLCEHRLEFGHDDQHQEDHDAYGDKQPHDFLLELRDSELKDENKLNELYDKIIANYYYPGNYLILVINQAYDVPGITADNIAMEDASDEVYNYILCCICPVTLSKPGLGYFENDKTFHNQVQSHMVDNPDIAFLFPAFNNRSADDEKILYHCKDIDDFQQNFLTYVLSCEIPLPANVQKETFNTLVTETLGDDCNYETVKNIHDNLNEIIDEHKAVSSAPVMLDKTEVKEILEKSGVKEEKLADFEEHFEMAAGENGKLAANNITPSRKFEVKTPDVVIKINPDKTDLVETRVIDGKQCLVIQIDEHLEVNGISVNPDTGEVIDRNENTNNNIY